MTAKWNPLLACVEKQGEFNDGNMASKLAAIPGR
jgi:hypothetical protein